MTRMKPFLLLLASLLPFAALHAAESPLNVLLITADDLGYEAMDFLDGKVPGKHTLRVVLGDFEHKVIAGLVSKPVTVTVK